MKCSVADCEAPVKHKGLCGKHYKRQWRHGNPNVRLTREYEAGQKCSNMFCDKAATIGGLCHACYQRQNRKGSTDYSIAPRGTGEPVTAAGYILLTINGERVYKHRKVMEEKLGRALLPGEVVHHIDGDTLNNSPDNLALFESQSAHMKHHASNK